MPEDFQLICLGCERTMRAELAWCGDPILCPHCRTPLRVPREIDPHTEAVRAERAAFTAREIFYFPCPRCENLLQAHTGMVRQRGTCPVCTARFLIPALRRGGQPTRGELLADESPEISAPLHAFAGSGSAAPQIVTRPDGQAVIQCPRCEAQSPIDAEVCEQCAVPFTLESAPSTAASRVSRRATASLITGVISVVLFPAFVPALIALWYGFQSAFEPTSNRAPLTAVAGICLGAFSLLLGGVWVYWMMT